MQDLPPTMDGAAELSLQFRFQSRPQQVTDTVKLASDWLVSHHVGESFCADVTLVLAEALNNVVEHAYLYSKDGEIDILVRLRPDRLQTTIKDKGRKFDGPPPVKEMDVENMDFEELPEGGFGWNLIRTLTDNVEFERKDEQNCLTLTRNLEVETAA